MNPARAARLPAGLVTALHGLVRIGFDGAALIAKEGWEAMGLHPYARGPSRIRRGSDPRGAYELRMVRALLTALPSSVREHLSGGMSWASLALYESSAPAVRLIAPGGQNADTGSPIAVAMAEIGYRLAIIAGSGPPEEWPVLDRAAIATPAVAWPARRHTQQGSGPAHHGLRGPPWFVAPLLVPDAWLSAHADPETLAQWARLTGRSGAPDRYWFPDTWDRFLEPGRRVGWLTANDVWRHRRGRLASATTPSADDESEYGGDPHSARSGALTLTPDLERGVGVPPGYALVQCVGTLEVAVIVRP